MTMEHEYARRVVVAATDFSDLATLALDAAIGDAMSTSAELHVIHVLPPMVIAPVPGLAPPPLGSAMMEMGTDGAGMPRDKAAALHELEQHVRGRVPSGVELGFECHVRVGRPAPEITRLAQQLEADALYLSTHGRSGLRRLVLGSVAESVIRVAPCPVVVMRPKSEEPVPASGHVGRGPETEKGRRSGSR